MKKIVFKIIFLLIILFIINLFINYSIIKKICDSNDEFSKSINNYYYIHNIEYTTGELQDVKTEIYAHNGIYLSNTYYGENLYSSSWFNSNTNETAGTINTKIVDYYKNILLNGNTDNNTVIRTILADNLFTHFREKDGFYIIKFNNSVVYIDAETKLIKKLVIGDTIQLYSIQKDIVTDNDVTKESLLK